MEAKMAFGSDEKRSRDDISIDGRGGDNDTVTVTLTDHIVMEEILPRLPVKPLCRFKSVSKFWRFTISKNPNFAKLHLKFSSSLHRHFFMMSYNSDFCEGMDDTFYLLPNRESSDMSDLVGLGGGSDADWVDVVGSCHGLVCLYYRVDDELSEEWERQRECSFDVWNPATRESRDIDSPPGVYIALAFGFGYVASLDDYMIVASFATERDGSEIFRGLYVFSLKTGEWERLIGLSDYSSRYRKWTKVKGTLKEESIAMKLEGKGVWINETLYWPPRRRYVAGYDSVSGELKEYTTMNWNDYRYDDVDLCQLKGCLALRGRKYHSGSDLWMLKNIDDWSFWQKLLSVDFRDVHLITLSETGKCLVQRSEQFKLVDPYNETLECIRGDQYRECMVNAVDHVESLISPKRTTKFNEENGNLESDDHLIVDRKLLQNKRVCPSQICNVKEVVPTNDTDTETDDEDDDSDNSEDGESDFEDDHENDDEWESDDENDDYEDHYSDEEEDTDEF